LKEYRIEGKANIAMFLILHPVKGGNQAWQMNM